MNDLKQKPKRKLKLIRKEAVQTYQNIAMNEKEKMEFMEEVSEYRNILVAIGMKEEAPRYNYKKSRRVAEEEDE